MNFNILANSSFSVPMIRVGFVWYSLFLPFAVYSQRNILFKDSVLVHSETVFLNDIVQITNTQCDSLDAFLGTIKVGTAAPPGFSRFMNTDDIMRYFVLPKVKNVALRYPPNKRIKITTDANIFYLKDFEKTIIAWLQRKIKWNKEDYTIDIEKPSSPIRCYRKPFTLHIDGLSSPYPKGNQRITMQLLQDGYTFSVPVRWRITVKTPVVCAKNTIPRNHRIAEDDIVLKKVDITAFRYTPFTNKTDVIGKCAVKTLTPETVLHGWCITKPAVIEKGDMVYIKLQKGPIRISVPARARQSGIEGEKIWVENVVSHKLIQVEVIKQGEVRLIEGESI